MGEASTAMSLGQLVKVLAATLQKRNVELPFKEQRRWHELFYELKKEKEEGHPNFLDDLVFDWDGPFPRCSALSEFLNAMHFTGNVSGHNPRFDVVSLDSETVNLWLSELDNADDEQKGFIDYAAKKAKSEFSNQETER